MRLSLRRTCCLCISATLLLIASAAALPPSGSSHKEPPVQLRSAAGLTEVGILDGAPYRIDIPADWNHSLVVYYHGYAVHPVSFHIAHRLTGQQAPLFDRHFAVAESAYSQTGWALQQAYPETESLRRYFTKKFGQPHETYVAGGSMGGALVMVTLELNPKPYLGGLDLCGSVGATSDTFDRRFALRAAFDVYFPGLMPPLVPVPQDFEPNRAERDRIAAALRRNPQAATTMRSFAGLRTDADLASDIAYFTFVIADMQRRAGGNPFDNTNRIYAGTGSSAADAALNDKVRRYTADPAARTYLVHHYTPTGRLGRPMLALHTLYDPIVTAPQLDSYNEKVLNAGFGSTLVQQYVDRDGHCNLTPDQVGDAFDELLQWTHSGRRPAPGRLKESHILSASLPSSSAPPR